jgi:hypothetical protein
MTNTVRLLARTGCSVAVLLLSGLSLSGLSGTAAAQVSGPPPQLTTADDWRNASLLADSGSDMVSQPAACNPSPTSLCLQNGRIRVQTTWRSGGGSGQGRARPITNDTGSFWFFDSDNVEILVKVLDACGFNQHFWVFASGLTDVGVTLTVTDTTTGRAKTYQNQQRKPFRLIQDTLAFDCP